MDVRFETKYGNKAGKHEWLTPKYIIDIIGPFDLDPCFSEPRPWDTALNYYTEKENGLIQEWNGFVWCNPPYGNYTEKWLERCSEYKNCLVLIFARTDTKMFRKYIWEKGKAIFFFYGRLRFYNADGTKGGDCAGAPSYIVAYNDLGVHKLKLLENLNEGKIVYL